MKLSLSAASLRLVSNTTVCVLLVLMCCCRCCWCSRGRPVTRDSLTSGADSTDISHTHAHTHTHPHTPRVCVCVCVCVCGDYSVLCGIKGLNEERGGLITECVPSAHTHTHTHTPSSTHIFTHTHILTLTSLINSYPSMMIKFRWSVVVHRTLWKCVCVCVCVCVVSTVNLLCSVMFDWHLVDGLSTTDISGFLSVEKLFTLWPLRRLGVSVQNPKTFSLY